MSPSSRRRAVVRATAFGALLLAAAAGCSFERRADTESDASGSEDASADVSGLASDEALMGVIEAYHRALGSGDAARLAQIVGPDALLVDQEEGVLWSASGTGALPGPLELPEPPRGGLTWERVGTRVDSLGMARLVILRYRATVAGEPVPWWGVESVLLQPDTGGAWRIHFVHRSRGPGGPGGGGR